MRSKTNLLNFTVLMLTSMMLCLLPSFLMAMEEEISKNEQRSIPVPYYLSPSFEEVEQNIQKRYPQFFLGKDKLDQSTIENYRKSWATFGGKNKDMFFTLHNPTLLPFLEKLRVNLESYGEKNLHHTEITKRFIREIQFYDENSAVTSCWLENLPIRFLCAISTNTPQEEDFFSHFPYPHSELFGVLQEHEAWKAHESTLKCLNRYQNSLLESPRYKHSLLSFEMVQTIEEVVKNALPVKVIYPLWGISKLGISFIVKEMLNDVFMVGLPFKNLTAHGIPLSPYGFAFHDLFHETVDHRRLEFTQYVIDQAENYIMNGGHFKEFLSHVIPSLIAKYQGLMGSLQEVYERLISTFDQLDSRKAMLGFFWILHEEPNFPSVIYTLKNFDDILTVITEDDGDPLENADDIFYNVSMGPQRTNRPILSENLPSTIDLDDPFQTNPLDGESQWEDEKIIYWVLENKKVREARKYAFFPYGGPMDELINKNDIIEQRVKRSARYIDVTFTLRQGGDLVYSFETLFYSLHAMHESLRLLNLLGIKVDLPDLSSSPYLRETAYYFIKKGERTMESLIRHFRKVASSFVKEDIPEKGILIQRYRQFYDGY